MTTKKIDLRFLDNAIGDGKLIYSVLLDKFDSIVTDEYDFTFHTLRALGSVYGISNDINEVYRCRNLLYSIWDECGDRRVKRVARFILNRNIICGDLKEGLRLGTSKPLFITEWLFVGQFMAWRKFKLDEIYNRPSTARAIRFHRPIHYLEFGDRLRH